jgi:ribosomal protein S18 acetylase RimI-like enzyme
MIFTRAADIESVRTLARLAREIWTEHYTPIIGPDQVAYMLEKFQSEEAIAAQIREGVLYFLCGAPGLSPLGYLAVLPRGEEMFLSKFYLLKQARGRGHGREMLRQVEALARERGCAKITLTVNRRNAETLAAYRAMGFSISSSIAPDIGGGYVMCDFCMEKKV